MDRSKPRRQLVWIVAIPVVLATALIIYIVVLRPDSKQQESAQSSAPAVETETFKDEERGISFEYVPSQLVGRELTEADKKDNVVVRFGGREAPILLYVQYETDLARASALLKHEPIDLVVENSGRVLPQKYPDYKAVSQRRFEHDGRKAAEIIFSYTGATKQIIKQRFMIVIQDSNTAVYMIGQALDDTFEKRNDEVFDKSFNSLRFTR